jgi:glycosyltransferase involved in cell wall biosynthesis
MAIPNGLDATRVMTKSAREDIRRSFGVARHENIILSIGRIERQKGLEYLWLAFSYLKPQLRENLYLFIAGSGTYEEKLRIKARKLKIDNRIRFLGFREDLGDLLLASDLVVLPSLREGLSISLLEAMAAGKPIITTSIGSNLEVSDNGRCCRIVPPKKPVPLAKAIEELIANKGLAISLAQIGKKRFLNNYTNEIMCKEYAKLYRKLIREKSLSLDVTNSLSY